MPVRARARCADGLLTDTASVHVELFGSLGATGHGHGTVKAVVVGLAGEMPDTVDPQHAEHLLSATREAGPLMLAGAHPISFDPDDDVVLHRRKRLAYHSNAMTFTVAAEDGTELASRTFYSVGGGFIVDEPAGPWPRALPWSGIRRRSRSRSAPGELIAQAERAGLPISGIVLRNECARRPEVEVRAGLLEIWRAMRQCVEAGLTADGQMLPGSLKVRRRASAMRQQFTERVWSRRSARSPGLGDRVRAGGERGKCCRRAGRDGADQRGGGDHARGAALLLELPHRAGRGRGRPLPADVAAGDRDASSRRTPRSGEQRWAARARSASACSMAAAGLARCAGRVAARRWRTRRRSGSSTIWGSPAIRSAGSCRSRASSGTRSRAITAINAARLALLRRRLAPGLARRGNQDDARHRRRHEVEVQGDLARRPRRQRRRVLRRPLMTDADAPESEPVAGPGGDGPDRRRWQWCIRRGLADGAVERLLNQVSPVHEPAAAAVQ